MNQVQRIIPYLVWAAVALLALSGCGGGGSSSGVSGGSQVTTTLTGVAAKGLIKGGTVRVYSIPATGDISQRQQLVPAVTTDPVTGSYSVNIGNYTGLILLEASGSYTDETDGLVKVLSIPLRASLVIGSQGGTVSAAITPFTEIALRVGFPDPSYFSRIFRQVTGMPPSAYRERKKL